MVVSVNPIDNGEPGIAQLGHVTLSTPDIEKSLWFYRDLLGMEEATRASASPARCTLMGR